MKVLLSPRDINHLEIAKDILYKMYASQLAMNEETLINNEIMSAQTTIDNVLREYSRTIEGIRRA